MLADRLSCQFLVRGGFEASAVTSLAVLRPKPCPDALVVLFSSGRHVSRLEKPLLRGTLVLI